jgi:hypothetical protein
VSFSIAFWDALLEQYLAPARAALGDEYDAVNAEGGSLAFDDAVELALRDDTQPATPESATVPPSASPLADGGELLG